MRRVQRLQVLVTGLVIGLVCLSVFLAQGMSGAAQSVPAGSVQALGGEAFLVTERVLPIALATIAASEALDTCTKQGYRVTVTVVDRAGLIKVMLRGDGAGPHTIDSSRLKAYTAGSTRRATSELEASLKTNPTSTLRDIPNLLLLAGGLPIAVGNDVLGGIGVGGAPGGNLDEVCAKAGIDKIVDQF